MPTIARQRMITLAAVAAAALLQFAWPAQDALAAAAATVFFVSLQGSDDWSGRLEKPNAGRTDGPFATLDRARLAIRALKQAPGGPTAPVTVMVADGVYTLDAPLTFTPEDSGTEAAPIVWRAAPGARPTIQGARVVGAWEEWRDGIYKTDLAAQGFDDPFFYQLFHKGERQVLARYPNLDPERPRTGGHLYVYQDQYRGKKKSYEPHSFFYYAEGDIPFDKIDDFSQAEIVSVYGGGWNTAVTPIRKIVRETRELHFKQPRRNFYRNNRYYIQNALGALDAPGEWFHDRKTDTLYFMPPDGRKPADGDVRVPVVDHLIQTDGTVPYPHGYLNTTHRGPREAFEMPADAPPMNPVEYLTFRGFDLQGARHCGVRFEGARRCAVEACRIRNVGNYGVNLGGVWPGHFEEGNPRREPDTGHWGGVSGGGQNIHFNDPCIECRVEGNDIHGTASDGIFLYGMDNVAENNHVYDTARLHKDSTCVNLWGERNVARRNELHDVPRNAVYLKGIDNVVELNEIHHTMLETCDGGAIRMCQRNLNIGGNVIRHNRITDTIGYGNRRGGDKFMSPYYCWGVYLDDWTCSTTVEGNIIVNCGRAGVMLHGGSFNHVDNNILIDTNMGGVEIAPIRVSPEGNLVRRNICLKREGNTIPYRYTRFFPEAASFARNVSYAPDGAVMVDVGRGTFQPWEEWMIERKLDEGSIVTDPKLDGLDENRPRPRPDSPAWGLGFEKIPFDKIGCYQGETRASWPLAVDPKLVRETPFLYWADPLPPEPLSLDFENDAPGAKPTGWDVVAPRPSVMEVTAERAASGKHCLKAVDAPNLRAAYLPRIFAPLRFPMGRARAAFDILLDADRPARVGLDLRQYTDSGAREYLLGAQLVFEPDGRVISRGKRVADIPLGEWTRVEILMTLGKEADGKAALSFKPRGGAETKVVLPCPNKEFSRLERAVFMTLANDSDGVWYLDNAVFEPIED